MSLKLNFEEDQALRPDSLAIGALTHDPTPRGLQKKTWLVQLWKIREDINVFIGTRSWGSIDEHPQIHWSGSTRTYGPAGPLDWASLDPSSTKPQPDPAERPRNIPKSAFACHSGSGTLRPDLAREKQKDTNLLERKGIHYIEYLYYIRERKRDWILIRLRRPISDHTSSMS